MRALLILSVCFAGCTTMPLAHELPGVGGAGSGGTGGGTVATNLPCDVDAILVANCQSCHGTTPSGGAPMSLVTYADLAAPAKTDPSQTTAQMCLTRVNSTAAPMPPTPPSLSAADIATLQAWVTGGMPMGNCSAGVDPLGAAPQCTSGQTWNGGNEGSSRMNPGQACINCHASRGGEAPRFSIAGTVYPSGHEPDLCYGTSAAQIVITDAAGKTLTLTPNSAGNFSSSTSVALPYHAKVVANGAERAMSAAQTSGDCNSCHTQFGANSAPGRITLP